MKKTTLTATVLLSLGVAGLAQTSQAALTAGTVLQFTAGVQQYDANGNSVTVSPGSWFGMDTNSNAKIAGTERTPISPGPDGGIVIGVTQDTNGHTSHSGPAHTNTGGLDNEWAFFGNSGMVFTSVAITDLAGSGATRSLDFSGWTVTWNGIPAINMGTNAWGTGFTNGRANIVCSSANCNVGDTFTLNYAATVPAGDPSGFGNVKYYVYMEGTIAANTPPTASNTGISTLPTGTADWAPTVSDPNGDSPITCAIVSQPASGQGTVTVASDCSTGIYTPGGFAGTTSFTYQACDPYGCTTDTVNVVTDPTPPPQCAADSTTVSGTTAVSIAVLGNDTDGDNNISTSTVAIVTNGSKGTATANADGTVTYARGADTNSFTDTFTYTVQDSDSQTCTAATVTITALAVTLPPDLSYSKTTSGCSLTDGRVNPAERGDWWIVAGFLAWLGALRMRFKRQTQS